MDVPPFAATTAPRSRRAALRAGGALAAALAAAGLGRAAARQATPAAGGAETGPVFVQGFGSGSLFRTQGSDPGLPPYTLYLWDAADHTVFFADRPERAAGLLATDRFLAALGAAAADPPLAALVAPPEESAGAATGEASVWVLRLVFAGVGSDPGAVTYQGELLEAAAAETRFGVRPAAAPDVQDVGAGYLFVVGVPDVDAGEGDGPRLTFG